SAHNVFSLYVFVTMLPTPLISTLFPYTTLFRSLQSLIPYSSVFELIESYFIIDLNLPRRSIHIEQVLVHYLQQLKHSMLIIQVRSEEHTSELQSRFDLVCRLLLEKKKKDILLPY